MIYDTYETMCGGAASGQDVKDCVEEKTFNLTETFPFGSQQGMGLLVEDLSSPDFWLSDTMVAVTGKKWEKEIQANSIAARKGWRTLMELWQGFLSEFSLRFALGKSLKPKKSCSCYLAFFANLGSQNAYHLLPCSATFDTSLLLPVESLL